VAELGLDFDVVGQCAEAGGGDARHKPVLMHCVIICVLFPS